MWVFSICGEFKALVRHLTPKIDRKDEHGQDRMVNTNLHNSYLYSTLQDKLMFLFVSNIDFIAGLTTLWLSPKTVENSQ